MMLGYEKKKINYIVSCISEFANRHGMKQNQAFRFLDKYQAIEFLKNNYDIEHTLSFEEVMGDMFVICKNNGGKL